MRSRKRCARLNDAGLPVSLLLPTSADEYFQQLTKGRFDLALGGWIAETADPSDFFEALLASHFVGHETFANASRWNDPETDTLLRRYRADPKDEHRIAIEHVISESLPFLPLVYGQSSPVNTRRVRNVNVTASGTVALCEVRVQG
jgi:ABC-type oligopeptide transport system substrate-binding subunit